MQLRVVFIVISYWMKGVISGSFVVFVEYVVVFFEAVMFVVVVGAVVVFVE